MEQRAGDGGGDVVSDVSNVVSMEEWGRRSLHDQSPVPSRAMTDAMRSFDRLEQSAVAMLQSGPLGVAGEIRDSQWPVVSFQVELPAVQQWLDQLGCIGVANWPDTAWVLSLGDARSAAVLCLEAVKKSLYRRPPGTGSLDGRLAADVRKLADALHRLRQLIGQQCPEALRAH
jgi:hypothetical protein